MNLERVLYDVFLYSAPIILCVPGGNFAYRMNMLNIALKDVLLMGAFTSVPFVILTRNIFLGILGSVIISPLLRLVSSFMSVTEKDSPVIAGLAINLIASLISIPILKAIGLPNLNINSIVDVAALKIHIPTIQSILLSGEVLSGHPFFTCLNSLGIFITRMVMHRIEFGVCVRVVGESKEVVVSMGIRTNRIEYATILISAVCCALAGANMTLERMALFTNSMSTGIDFIAIAAISCGKGQSVRTSPYAMPFGLMQALAVNLSISAGPASSLLNTLPYFTVIMILTVISAMQL